MNEVLYRSYILKIIKNANVYTNYAQYIHEISEMEYWNGKTLNWIESVKRAELQSGKGEDHITECQIVNIQNYIYKSVL